MTSISLGPALTKEVRALLPTWLACLLILVLETLTSDAGLFFVGVFAYGLGSIALGAQSLGHEYTSRTLPLLLVQPRSRPQLLLTKLAVLVAMLLVLNLIAWNVLTRAAAEQPAWFLHPSSLLVVVACTLALAPWLTMICRSPLAGIVFATGIPGMVWVSAGVIGLVKLGLTSASKIEALALSIWWPAIFVIWTVGAFAGWRTFMRLEAVDGRGPEIHLPTWLRWREAKMPSVAAAKAGHPLWHLVRKELHLQQMAFAVAGLYIIGWLTAVMLERFVPDFPVDFPLLPLTIMYFALLSILIGSLASAEERQFGTLEWQVLQPMPMWQQWLVKVSIVVGLALALGVGLPMVLRYIYPSADIAAQGVRFGRGGFIVLSVVPTALMFTAVSLYVSTLSTAGVRALVLSIPVAFGGVLAFVKLNSPFASGWLLREMFGRLRFQRATDGIFPVTLIQRVEAINSGLWFGTEAALAALLVWFALGNHRSVERSNVRIVRHVMVLAGLLALAAVVNTSIQGWLWTRIPGAYFTR